MNSDNEVIDTSRRKLLVGAATVCTSFFILPSAEAALKKTDRRTLSFDNLHTDEKLRVTYWKNGHYVPDALREINYILRDFRTGDVTSMDRDLLNLLVALQRRVGSTRPFEIISGYRSPATNAMLHEQSGGVAKHSMHMEGKATDIRLADRSLKDIRRAAIMLGRGGVGYYPKSDFVHVDTGKVRKW